MLDLASIPGVVLVGRVETLESEMARSDLAVVPIRFGGGTRLKVVEALANRLPVVTTTVGCEGIDVVDGHSALIADDAAGFAAACVRVLTEPELRAALVGEGRELFEAHYQWSQIRHRLAEVCRAVATRESADRISNHGR
jgi:glycosyltransferase involved in cell wall biosynthesis